MPASAKCQCPLCGKTNKIPSRLLGKKIRCAACKKVFTSIADDEELEELDDVEIVEDKPRRRSSRRDDDADDDEDDDRPRRSKKKKKKKRAESGSSKTRDMIFGSLAILLGSLSLIGAIISGVSGGRIAFPILGATLLIGGIGTVINALNK